MELKGPYLGKRVNGESIKICVAQGPMIPVGIREKWQVPTMWLWGSEARLSGSHGQGNIEALFLLL